MLTDLRARLDKAPVFIRLKSGPRVVAILRRGLDS